MLERQNLNPYHLLLVVYQCPPASIHLYTHYCHAKGSAQHGRGRT